MHSPFFSRAFGGSFFPVDDDEEADLEGKSGRRSKTAMSLTTPLRGGSGSDSVVDVAVATGAGWESFGWVCPLMVELRD